MAHIIISTVLSIAFNAQIINDHWMTVLYKIGASARASFQISVEIFDKIDQQCVASPVNRPS